MAQYATSARTEGAEREMILRDERAGKPYDVDYMQKLHKRIREKAGLQTDLRFTSLRHGGLTEIGDSGEAHMRAISGHSEIKITKIYDKTNLEKARCIIRACREYISKVISAK